MIPEKFQERILGQNSVPDAISLLKSLEDQGPVSIRVNSNKVIASGNLERKVPWAESGYYLTHRPFFTFDPFFQAGGYYVQEASSMFLEEVLRQSCNEIEDPRILDLCGAPGGKSVILSDFAGDKGLVVANEVIRSRAHILAENIMKWGTANSVVTSSDPSAFKRLPGFFDIMVVDAPCSGEGMFRDLTAREQWSVANTVICGERQRRILSDSWPALKEGGILIYSTCTFNPSENEDNMEWLRKENHAESISIDVSSFEGVTELVHHGIKGYYFFPHKTRGEGFFISVMRKGKGVQSARTEKGGQPFSLPSVSEIKAVDNWIAGSTERLLKIGDDLILTHTDKEILAFIYARLGLVKGGTRIAVFKGSKALPNHDLALSTMLDKNAFAKADLTFSEAISFFKRDAFTLPGKEKGHLLMTYKDLPIGFANNLGNRINTFIPVELRIRSDKPVDMITDPGIVLSLIKNGINY